MQLFSPSLLIIKIYPVCILARFLSDRNIKQSSFDDTLIFKSVYFIYFTRLEGHLLFIYAFRSSFISLSLLLI